MQCCPELLASGEPAFRFTMSRTCWRTATASKRYPRPTRGFPRARSSWPPLYARAWLRSPHGVTDISTLGSSPRQLSSGWKYQRRLSGRPSPPSSALPVIGVESPAPRSAWPRELDLLQRNHEEIVVRLPLQPLIADWELAAPRFMEGLTERLTSLVEIRSSDWNVSNSSVVGDRACRGRLYQGVASVVLRPANSR